MPLSRAVLERQLKQAELSLADRVKALKGAGKAEETYSLDPVWRSASAACASIRRRLVAVAAVEANDAEVARRKLEPKPEPAKEEAKPAKSEKAKAEKSKAAAKPEEQKSKKEKAKPAKAE